MDIKQLLEKMEEFAGEKVGQKSGDQWRGTDKGTPGKKLVGDSIIKDLSKGPTPKTKEQELAEEWATFSEENIGTHPKRAGRKSDRHSRGHEPQPRYKTVKADEGLENPHPASKDPIVAKVVKQMRPGLKNLDMNNEAFLYFAYELGKMRARDSWEDYLPAIRHAYEQGLSEDANTDNKLAKLLTRFINQNEGAGHAVASDAIEYIKKIGHIEQFATSLDYFGVDLDEGWESGPEEYEEPYDDADDAYDRQRQEKIDTEAEKEWDKLPKVSTYKLIGRGPNMEPNYEFGDEFDTLEQAVEYRAKIMKDPKTPYPEHIGIRTLTRVVDKTQTDEAVKGGGGIKNIEDYTAKRDYIYQQLANPKQVDNYPHFRQALYDLMRLAREKGIKIEESRAHKQLATWFKNREVAQKYASGELKVPTPQERQAQLAKQQPKKEKVDEYGANNPAQATTQKASPAQIQQVAANLNTQKTALNQLKQINPEIDPQKAATAVTKDVATMSPQEKEELAQVAKTLSPALGTPALGTIKTAIQKSQLQAKK
jgi:hypothetical protein